jgi:hypothetical protein
MPSEGTNIGSCCSMKAYMEMKVNIQPEVNGRLIHIHFTLWRKSSIYPLYRRLSKPKNHTKHSDVEEKNPNAPDDPLTQIIQYTDNNFTD